MFNVGHRFIFAKIIVIFIRYIFIKFELYFDIYINIIICKIVVIKQTSINIITYLVVKSI